MVAQKEKNEDRQMVHWLIHALYAVVLACGGFITAQIFNSLDKLGDKVDEVPMVYVQKADYKSDQDNLAIALQNLADKIDHSSEYMEADYNRRMDKLEKLLIEKMDR